MPSPALMSHAIFWRPHQHLLWTILPILALSGVILLLLRRNRTLAAALEVHAARLTRTEDENRHMQSSLLAAQKLEDWSRMSAVVTHEIGNPLESIQNILYLIRQSDSATNEIVRLTRMASEEADRILTISRSTLSFFRQSSTPELVDLRAAAESVRFLLEPVLRRRELTLRIHCSGDLAIHAFACELRQVLLNLVRNACDASPRRGSLVTVNLAGLADHVTITVTDNGTGIAPDLLPTIFHFGRTTKGPHGNGMGLWTVKHIVDKHGGEVHVHSEPNKGTDFTILWPRRIDHPIPATRHAASLAAVTA